MTNYDDPRDRLRAVAASPALERAAPEVGEAIERVLRESSNWPRADLAPVAELAEEARRSILFYSGGDD